MSLRCSRGKCYYILAPRSVQSCALFLFFVWQWVLLIEKKDYIIIFFFMSTINNLWKQFRPNKMFSRECLHLQTRISLRCWRRKCYVSFSAPISVLNHLLLVSSAGNLFKQLSPRPGPVKLSCENGAHVKSRMREECFLGGFLSAHFCPSTSTVIL